MNDYRKESGSTSMLEFTAPFSRGRGSGELINKSMVYPSLKQKQKRPQTSIKPINLVPLVKKDIKDRMVMSKTLNYGQSEESVKANSSKAHTKNGSKNQEQQASLSFSHSRKDKHLNVQNKSMDIKEYSPSRSFTPDEQNSN